MDREQIRGGYSSKRATKNDDYMALVAFFLFPSKPTADIEYRKGRVDMRKNVFHDQGSKRG
jgi:hypothetical protein